MQLVELDMLTSTYTTLYTLSDSPFVVKHHNAIALNPVDGIAYGKFTDPNDQDFFCRFSADPSSEPLQCLCALTNAGKGGVLGLGSGLDRVQQLRLLRRRRGQLAGHPLDLTRERGQAIALLARLALG